jgi:hypothetical protein
MAAQWFFLMEQKKLVGCINIGVLGFGIAIIFAITAVFIDMNNKFTVESS